MPSFKHFCIWDNEVQLLINDIEANDIVKYLSKEVRDWLYWDGCLIYAENEFGTLHSEASNSLKTKGRFADMGEPSMLGHIMLALEGLGNAFCEYFKDDSNEEANKLLRLMFDEFILLALRNHRPFIRNRAIVTNNLDLNKLELKTVNTGQKSLKAFSVFIVSELENIKKELKKSDDDESYAVISDINQFIIYRKEYEKLEFTATSTPRLSRSPQLISKSIGSQSSASSINSVSVAQSPIVAKKPTLNLLSSLSNFKLYDSGATKKADNKDEVPKTDFVLKLK